MAQSNTTATARAVQGGRGPSSLHVTKAPIVHLENRTHAQGTFGPNTGRAFIPSHVGPSDNSALNYRLVGDVLGVRDLNDQPDGFLLHPVQPQPGHDGILKFLAFAHASPRFDAAPTFFREVSELRSNSPLLLTNNPECASVAAHEFGIGAVTLLAGGTDVTFIPYLKARVRDLERQLEEHVNRRGLPRRYLFAFDEQIGSPVKGYDGLAWLMEATRERGVDVAALYLSPYSREPEPAFQRLRTYLSTLQGI